MTDAYISSSNARTQKLWDRQLFMDWPKKSFFGKRFLSNGFDNIVRVKEDLTKNKGDAITVGIRMRNKDGFLPSGTKVDTNEGRLSTFTDQVVVDEKNFGIVNDSIITEQRAYYDVREEMHDTLVTQAAENIDREFFTALDAANTTCAYQVAGSFALSSTLATAVAAVTTSDKLSPEFLTKIKPGLFTGFNEAQSYIEPIMIDGQEMWVVLVHPDVLADLENDSTFLQSRQVALERGKENPIFTGAWAIWNQFIIYAHQNVGIGTNASSVPYARCHVLGKGSLIQAWAKKPTIEKKKPPYDTQEMGFGFFSTFGVKKTQFNGKDYGAMNLIVARGSYSDVTYS